MSARSVVPQRAASALLASAVLLAGCAGTDDPPESAQTSATTTDSGTTPSGPSSSPSLAPPSPTGTSIDVSFAAGQVNGDVGRISAPLDEPVTITVASDVADEMHVHGYDLTAEVGPDAAGTLTFQASLPGVFEVELEQRGTLLLTLQVG